MDENPKTEVIRFPATQRSDTVFGALAGAILGIADSQLMAFFLALAESRILVGFFGLVIGALIGASAGFLHNTIRENFATSELGVRLGIGFLVLPSLIPFFHAVGFADGRGTIRLVVAIAFGGVMGGLLVGSVFDRIYESVLRKRLAKNPAADIPRR